MNAALRKYPFFLPFGGCRGRCVYCDQQTITGTDELIPPAGVRDALSKLTEPREVCYFGGSFCRFGLDTVKAYLDAVTECAPCGSRIRFSTYPGDLRDKKLRALVSGYPLGCIELGIPSLDPAVLSACNRDANPVMILSDISVLRDEGFPLGVQMMIGLPSQTKASTLSDLEKLAAAKEMQSWQIRLYPCLVIRNTELARMTERGGYAPLSLEYAVEWGGEFLERATDLGFIPIRVGLQESALLEDEVLGGPHHPALGEMIYASMLVRKLFRNSRGGPWVVPAEHVSKLKGHKELGLRLLAREAQISLQQAKERVCFY